MVQNNEGDTSSMVKGRKRDSLGRQRMQRLGLWAGVPKQLQAQGERELMGQGPEEYGGYRDGTLV
jgi:hypothetical protein